MRRHTTFAALLLVLGTGSASAELRAQNIWSDWTDYLGTFGLAVEGQATVLGDDMRIEDATVTFPLAEVDGAITIRVGDIDLTEVDGTVQIAAGETWTVDFDVAPEDGEDVSGTLVFEQTDPVIVVSGETDALTYTYDAASAEMRMDGLTVDGVQLDAETFAFQVQFEDIAKVTEMTKANLRSFAQQLDIGNLLVQYTIGESESDSAFTGKSEISGISYAATGALPFDADTNNASALILAGMNFDGTYSYQTGSNESAFASADGTGTVNSTNEGGTMAMRLSDAGLVFDSEGRNVAVTAVSSQLPLPFSFLAERAKARFALPTIKDDEPQDFGMLLSFEDFSMADTLWSLFDPSQALPRDPATLTVDLAGTAKLLYNWLDPEQMAQLEQTNATPGELVSLSLKSLVLDIAGARLMGDGAFTFDNADRATFDGFPRPEGALDLSIEGANGLIDKLVGIGLLPEENAMGARMMMGLFARPGDGPDALVSKIEVNPAGEVLANGQRIR